jgi:hypothetical protein
MLKADNESWFYEANGEIYYLIQNRDNTLINSMQKVRTISHSVELERFARTLGKSLNRVPIPHRPPYEILKEYLETSKYTILVNENIKLNLPPRELTQIELDVVELLENTPQMSSSSIRNSLREKGHGEAFIQKNVFASALVYVDESEGRGHYTFSLIGDTSSEEDTDTITDRYAEFVQKLKNISIEGTDREQSVNARLEQAILREWLFGEKYTENCAICGEEFSVTSLIAAHKKRRAECSENERTNPHIVMPLCLFGCDCMYERKYLRIHAGKVETNILPEGLTERENSFIKSVIGTSVEPRWLEGSLTYLK